ncbi:copper homeostasis protein CutC [Mucilaginibacter terrae]|uniref:PF03932 family protein CutC n=1 Tax=Mucilaginibacter terrae TaxID=1955052 RepID=A0ABU3H0T6_9SPHI|nr:copper homeostasis protein CutC [Mucilaginibacter terrae]MDT3405633.1 copper homeostasis protein [Mucilaginibacter terrae]
MNIALEVCANSVESAIAAQKGGATRIELCDNLHEGGTTPSYGQIKVTLSKIDIPVYVLLRPRTGDFLYSDAEYDVMKANLEMAAQLGCHAIVTGILHANGTIDKKRCTELVQMAKRAGMKATFHRAFDLCADMFHALEEIIDMGFDCILTSGGKTTAIEGASKIAQLIQKANGRICIMPGGGVSEYNVNDLVHFTGATEIHSSARKIRKTGMEFMNENILLGRSVGKDYDIDETDTERVRTIIQKANEPYPLLKDTQGQYQS